MAYYPADSCAISPSAFLFLVVIRLCQANFELSRIIDACKTAYCCRKAVIPLRIQDHRTALKQEVMKMKLTLIALLVVMLIAETDAYRRRYRQRNPPPPSPPPQPPPPTTTSPVVEVLSVVVVVMVVAALVIVAVVVVVAMAAPTTTTMTTTPETTTTTIEVRSFVKSFLSG